LATMFFFVFPLVAIIGLIIGGIGYFQPNYAKFYSVLGVVLNVLNLLLWVGFVIFQITFNANRFRL
jgi:TRAP-type C4-dicarboxylate transport system permease small subunit